MGFYKRAAEPFRVSKDLKCVTLPLPLRSWALSHLEVVQLLLPLQLLVVLLLPLPPLLLLLLRRRVRRKMMTWASDSSTKLGALKISVGQIASSSNCSLLPEIN